MVRCFTDWLIFKKTAKSEEGLKRLKVRQSMVDKRWN
jgi:hypothetical protein